MQKKCTFYLFCGIIPFNLLIDCRKNRDTERETALVHPYQSLENLEMFMCACVLTFCWFYYHLAFAHSSKSFQPVLCHRSHTQMCALSLSFARVCICQMLEYTLAIYHT